MIVFQTQKEKKSTGLKRVKLMVLCVIESKYNVWIILHYNGSISIIRIQGFAAK